jgi:hypothetical protein
MLYPHFAQNLHCSQMSGDMQVCRHYRGILSTSKPYLHLFFSSQVTKASLRYTAQIFMWALDSETRELIGLEIGEAHGIAV